MKKTIALVLATVMALSTLVGCGSKKEAVAENESLSVCLASEPQTMDPALNSTIDGGTMLIHLFSGLAKWNQNEDGSISVVADMAEELVEPVDNGDGTFTYTYTIRDAKWSDGKAVTANDFEFAWNRASSVALASDYGYMYEVVDGYDAVWAEDATGDEKLNIKAVDEKTFEVTTVGNLPYWNELLAFPTFFPVREDVVDNDGTWATDPKTYVSNGLYTLSAWEHNSVITLSKNENHPDVAEVKMPELKFYLSDDNNNMLANFKNGDWLLIDDVPTNEIASLKENYPTEFFIAGQIGTYYTVWNINEDLSPVGGETLTPEQQNEVRRALNLIYDRNYLCNDISQDGVVPASSFVAMGITESDGSTQFYQNTGYSSDFEGYFNVDSSALSANLEGCMSVLSKYYDVQDGKVTNFPTLTYIYNTNEKHKAIAEYLQSALANIGVTMNLENQEWATFIETRKAGDYSAARNGWVADYNDAISFLDMWVTGSGNNDVQFGREGAESAAIWSVDLSEYGYDKVENGTWAETYDKLISLIKDEDDLAVRDGLMHKAEDLLMESGAICPLFFYTDLYMLNDSVSGFFTTPLGFKHFEYTTIEKAE